jgi:hypothetical protein
LLRLSKGNLSEAIGELVRCRFLQAQPTDDEGIVYRVLPDSLQWVVAWRYERFVFAEYLRGLDLVSEQEQTVLLEPEPDLKAAMATSCQCRTQNAECRMAKRGFR